MHKVSLCIHLKHTKKPFHLYIEDHNALIAQTDLLLDVYTKLNEMAPGVQQNWTVECQMGPNTTNQITAVVNKFPNVKISYTNTPRGPLEGVSANPRQWALMHRLTQTMLEGHQVQFHRTKFFSSCFSKSGGRVMPAKAEFFLQLQNMRMIQKINPETGRVSEAKYEAPGNLYDDGAKAWMYAMFGAKCKLPLL